MEIDNKENNINKNVENEGLNLPKIAQDIDLLASGTKLEITKRIEEMNNTIITTKKNEGKVDLYNHEIGRLENELKDIKFNLKKYESEANAKKELSDLLLEEYN